MKSKRVLLSLLSQVRECVRCHQKCHPFASSLSALSAAGGALGLYLGASLIVCVEFVEVIFQMIAAAFFRAAKSP